MKLRGHLLALALLSIPAFAAEFGFDDQWGLDNTGQKECGPEAASCLAGSAGADIHFKESRAVGSDCSSIVTAVIDSGVDYDHPALAGNLLPGKTFLYGHEKDGAQDDYYHGTHVTGIIAANGTPATGGIVGICQKAKILPIKVTDAMGDLSDADIILAVQYAAAQGARVVNLSFSGPDENSMLKEAMHDADRTLFVISAGNGDENGVGVNIDEQHLYPSSYLLDNIITVAATDSLDHLVDYSNYGVSTVALAAPGMHIVSTVPMEPTQVMRLRAMNSAVAFLDGTSMSAPFVAGAAALVTSAEPDLTPAEVKTRLTSAVDQIAGLKGKVTSGGRLDLSKLFPESGGK